MKQRATRNKGPANVLRVLVVIVIALSAAKVVTDAIQESNAGDIQGLRQTLTFGAIAGSVVLMVWVGIALALIPSARRKRILGATFPDDVVVNGRCNEELNAYLVQRLATGSRSTELKGIAFTLVADSRSVSFWTGFSKERKAAEIDWSEIQGIRRGAMSLSQVRVASTVELTLNPAGARIQFALASESWLGAFPQDNSSVDQLIAELETLRFVALSSH